jgi:hypothetical protein
MKKSRQVHRSATEVASLPGRDMRSHPIVRHSLTDIFARCTASRERSVVVESIESIETIEQSNQSNQSKQSNNRTIESIEQSNNRINRKNLVV